MEEEDVVVDVEEVGEVVVPFGSRSSRSRSVVDVVVPCRSRSRCSSRSRLEVVMVVVHKRRRSSRGRGTRLISVGDHGGSSLPGAHEGG